MPKSSKRRYNSGWSQHNTQTTYRPTVRDTGYGSGKNAQHMPKSTDDDPKTWEEIRDECLEGGFQWEDPDFPAEADTLFYNTPPSVWPNVQWQRPHEICDNPKLFVGGADRMDVNQGVLGDCWFLAAVAGLATNERLLHRVVPTDQSFNEGEYAGVFKFWFWQYGRWVEVLVDDRLPTCNGRLIYMHSDSNNEFWSALIEKAYAKLNGCYECLSGGLTSEAMTDFTGGIVERVNLRDDAPDDLWRTMLHAHKRYSLFGCSIDASRDQMESELDNGLIIGHAYTMSDVRLVETENGPLEMVRVRNPWGDKHEWTGAWGDQSEEWTTISDEERENMGLTFEDDGEFWMSFEDWKTEFQRCEICYLGPDTLLEEDDGTMVQVLSMWEGDLHEGSWRKRVNAGGCRNYPSTFWANPQYRISITEGDEDDEEGAQAVVIGVMQKERRKMRREGEMDLTIGYAVYELDDPNQGTLDERYFKTHASIAKSPAFTNMREVSDHHRLAPGDYVILPSTFEPNFEGDFIVRIFSENKDEVAELDDETAINDPGAEEEEDDDDSGKKDAAMEAFNNLAGEDGEVSAYELKDILNGLFMEEFEFDGFSTDMCRSMVAMKDTDFSGKLGFENFNDLFSDLRMCKKAFLKLDVDGNGFFSSYEFRTALNSLVRSIPGMKGLRVSNATFNAIVMRYSDNEGHVRFDDFVACVIKMKTMFETYQEKEEDGQASFKMDEFVQLTMYS